MAKEEATKPKWYTAFWQAFQFVRKNDKVFMPAFITIVVVIIAAGVVTGIISGKLVGHIYANLTAVLMAVLAALILLTSRINTAVLNMVEGTPGASLRAVQLIRRGWSFEDDPIAVDGKGKVVLFLGVGKGGVALVAEGGHAAHKVMTTTSRRFAKLVPGVPIHEVYMGDGPGQVPLRELPKHVRGLKKALNKNEQAAVRARLHAVGGAALPVPKGIDPMRARPNRKAMRG